MDKRLERQCLRIAQYLAPKDTGNLAFNAINVRNSTKSSFTINYSSSLAHYIRYVEEGTEKQDAQRFIEATWFELSNFIKDYFEGNGTKHKKNYRKSFYEDKRLRERELVRQRSFNMRNITM